MKKLKKLKNNINYYFVDTLMNYIKLQINIFYFSMLSFIEKLVKLILDSIAINEKLISKEDNQNI